MFGVLSAPIVAAFVALPHASGAGAQEAIGVSALGDDATCVRGNRSKPCASINRAYSIARCGDTVEVAAGTYGRQVIYEVSGLSACSTNVTIQPADGAAVSVDRIDLGTVDGGQVTDAPDKLTIKGFKMPDGIAMYGDATDITIDSIDGGAFFITGGRRITVKNSDWGPCNSSGDTNCETFFSRQIVIADSDATSDIVVEGNTIHDFALNGPNDHYECVRTSGGTNLTFRRNRLFNCEIYGMTITNPAGTWLIENNFFGRTSCCAYAAPQVDHSTAIVLGDGTAGARVIIRNNNFGRNQTVVSEGATGFGTVSVTRNILDSRTCVPDVVYTSNLFIRYDVGANIFLGGKACAPTDRTSVYGYIYDGQRLRPDGVRASAVRNAFAGVANQLAMSKLRALLRRIAPPPPGGWTKKVITELTRDPVYLGGRLGMGSAHPPLIKLSRWKVVQSRWRTSERPARS